MNITFTGPQCSGKTTLLKKMKAGDCSQWIGNQFFYIDEVTRLVKREFNVNINEDGANDITQLLIINKELENLFRADILSSFKGVIHDRCLMDGFLYTDYFHDKKLVSDNVWMQSMWYWLRFHTKYDIIFYPDPADVTLVDDGERSTNNEFRIAMIEKFDHYIKQWQWKDRVFRLKGTVEERMEQIKIVLNEHATR
jgi:thymidylate kinase